MPVILLTRPAPAAARFAERLRRRLGEVEIVIAPLLEMEWLGTLPEERATPIFTSQNGVEAYLRAGGRAEGACWCVGEATARAARTAGFEPRTGGGDAQVLAAGILASGARGPFLHVRGRHARGDLAETLRAGGCNVEEAVLYDQRAHPLGEEALAALGRDNPVVLPLFSPRSAAQFVSGARPRAPLFVAAMSRAVAEEAAPLGPAALEIAARPDGASMADATERLFDAALRLEAERAAK